MDSVRWTCWIHSGHGLSRRRSLGSSRNHPPPPPPRPHHKRERVTSSKNVCVGGYSGQGFSGSFEAPWSEWSGSLGAWRIVTNFIVFSLFISFVFPKFTSFHSVFHSFHELMNSINWPACQCMSLHSSAGRALQRELRGHGFESRWSPEKPFFRAIFAIA